MNWRAIVRAYSRYDGHIVEECAYSAETLLALTKHIARVDAPWAWHRAGGRRVEMKLGMSWEECR